MVSFLYYFLSLLWSLTQGNEAQTKKKYCAQFSHGTVYRWSSSVYGLFHSKRRRKLLRDNAQILGPSVYQTGTHDFWRTGKGRAVSNCFWSYDYQASDVFNKQYSTLLFFYISVRTSSATWRSLKFVVKRTREKWRSAPTGRGSLESNFMWVLGHKFFSFLFFCNWAFLYYGEFLDLVPGHDARRNTAKALWSKWF